MSAGEPERVDSTERVDVESTPLFSGKDRREKYSGTAASSKTISYEEEHSLLPPSANGHYPYLDMTRIACVWLVAVDHGNSTFGEYNIVFGQDWVLQFLFLVCGVCFGMSKRTLFSYQMRLAQYVVIGVIINWSAWIGTGMDWQNNFFGVVFHFWFVVGVMMYSTILAPLRPYLQRVRDEAKKNDAPEAVDADGADSPLSVQDHRDSLLKGLFLICGGLLGILLVFHVAVSPLLNLAAPGLVKIVAPMGSSGSFWGLPGTVAESTAFLGRLCDYFMCTCGNIYLLVVCPKVFRRPGFIPWVVFFYTYAHRLFFFRAADERPFHGLDLMMFALSVYYLGLQYRRTVGEYLIRYWFVLLFVCALLWPPGVRHRFDEDPPLDLSLRIRVNLLEAIFVIAWFVAGDRMVQKEIFTEDKLDFLNLWALIVFLVHKAVHIVFTPPWNWAVLIALAPACYFATKKSEDDSDER